MAMPWTAIRSRLGKLRQRFGIAAPRVAVRTQAPWYLRWLGLGVVLGLSLALASWMYDVGSTMAGVNRGEIREELARARTELETQRAEVARLGAIANAADSRLAIERTAQKDLAGQMKSLEAENARLREEIAVFENMLASAGRVNQPVTIQRFRVEPDPGSGGFRYNLLLVAGAGRPERDFQGRFELTVNTVNQGRGVIIALPSAATDGDGFRLNFKNFRRVSGIFKPPAGSSLESVEVKVFEAGVSAARATMVAKPG
jgi:hypothetical protein